MSNFFKFIIGFNILLLALILIMPSRQTSWVPSYWHEDTKPYGSYLFEKMMEPVLGLENVNMGYTRIMEDGKLKIDTSYSSYVFYNNILNFTYDEAQVMKTNVRNGATLMLNYSYYYNYNSLPLKSTYLSDSLNEIEGLSPEALLKDKVAATIVMRETGESIEVDIEKSHTFIEPTDSCDCRVIADAVIGKKKFAAITEISEGSGRNIINTLPEVFSNYVILENESDDISAFLERLMSEIDFSQDVLWDRYYKTGRPAGVSSSLLRVAFSYPGLKAAYFILIAGIFIFFIFQSRRKQRMIPVIPKPENQSLSYSKNISYLHQRYSNNKILFNKAVKNWVSHIEDITHHNPMNVDDEVLSYISRKTNLKIEDLQKAITSVQRLNKKSTISNQELKNIYNLLHLLTPQYHD